MPESYSNVLPYGAITTLWEDLVVEASALSPGATPADPIIFGPSGAVRIRAFDGAGTLEDMDLVAELPHTYKEGSDIEAHVHWCPTTNDAGNVKWNLSYYWMSVGDVIPVLATISIVQAASGTAWNHQMADFPTIVGAGKKISSMLICRIFRDPTDVQDTYTHDAGLFAMDFHYLVNSSGSRQEDDIK